MTVMINQPPPTQETSAVITLLGDVISKLNDAKTSNYFGYIWDDNQSSRDYNYVSLTKKDANHALGRSMTRYEITYDGFGFWGRGNPRIKSVAVFQDGKQVAFWNAKLADKQTREIINLQLLSIKETMKTFDFINAEEKIKKAMAT